jgi:putative transposase
MSRRLNRGPSPGWREFLRRHESNIWACDFFCVRTILFQTLYVFFVVRHVNREILHIAVTPYPTAEWTAQQLVECCAWDRWPPRFLIHDRDSRYGATFERRLRHLGIEQVRTPFRAPRANAISERWVKSVRTEYLDHLFIFSESHLRRAVSSYVAYFNGWRPHRSLVNARPVIRQPSRSELARPTARLWQSQYSAACITFISLRHDGLYFCALVCCRDNWKGGRYVVKLCKR